MEFTALTQTTARSVDGQTDTLCVSIVTVMFMLFLDLLLVLLLLLQVSSLSPQMEVRALVEGQFLSRRLHAERLGYSISKSTSPSPLFSSLLLFNSVPSW